MVITIDPQRSFTGSFKLFDVDAEPHNRPTKLDSLVTRPV